MSIAIETKIALRLLIAIFFWWGFWSDIDSTILRGKWVTCPTRGESYVGE